MPDYEERRERERERERKGRGEGESGGEKEEKKVVCLSRYDMYDIEIHPESSVQMPHGTVYATEGFHYVTVSVEEVLFEGGRSIR